MALHGGRVRMKGRGPRFSRRQLVRGEAGGGAQNLWLYLVQAGLVTGELGWVLFWGLRSPSFSPFQPLKPSVSRRI